MVYGLCVDDPTNRARVHKGWCSHCSDGKWVKVTPRRQPVVRAVRDGR